MTSTDPRSTTSPGPVWVVRLTELVELAYLVIRVNAVWLLLTLLGLVVLGAAPATCAAADTFIAGRHGTPVRVWSTMWATYRTQFVRANARMLPLLLVQVGALLMLWIVAGGGAGGAMMTAVLGGLAAISLAWATTSAGSIAAVPRVRRQDLLVTWRIALLLPGALPLRTIGLSLLLAAWVLVCWAVWPIGLLLGAGTAIGIGVRLLGLRGELLLEDLDATRTATARS